MNNRYIKMNDKKCECTHKSDITYITTYNTYNWKEFLNKRPEIDQNIINNIYFDCIVYSNEIPQPMSYNDFLNYFNNPNNFKKIKESLELKQFIFDFKYKKISSIDIKTYIDKKDNLDQLIKDGKCSYFHCINKNEIIPVGFKKNLKTKYFRHKAFEIENHMTEWHRTWQSKFDKIEIKIGEHEVDALCGHDDKNIIEFQHSPINVEDINSRTENAIKYNKHIYWIIDGNNNIEIIRSDNLINIKFCNIWLFEKFSEIDHIEFIYIDYQNCIYRINPNLVRLNNIETMIISDNSNINVSHDLFLDFLKNDKEIIWPEFGEKCKLYYNQRGAGSGKTYESVQILNDLNEFKDKQTFIYLTKIMAATEVIFEEITQQYLLKKLNNITIKQFDENLLNNKIIYDGMKTCDEKKYNFKFNKNERECHIIISTIDAFKYAIGRNIDNEIDMFQGILNSIMKKQVMKIHTDGSIKMGSINEKIILNSETLIIIDETQDLNELYIKSLINIMNRTGSDAFLIGDKLQSIYNETNSYTFLENISKNNEYLKYINFIKREKEKNEVMRFHNNKFINIVNNIVNFKKFNLKPIDSICDGQKCKYSNCGNHLHSHKEFQPFEICDIYEKNIKWLNRTIDKITDYMDNEIKYDNYINKLLPQNFMFIFPMLKQSSLANMLSIKLQEYWKEKFRNIDYYQNVINKLDDNHYWTHLWKRWKNY